MAELSQGGRSVVATASSAVTRPSASWIQAVSASVGPGIAARTAARASSTERRGSVVPADGAARSLIGTAASGWSAGRRSRVPAGACIVVAAARLVVGAVLGPSPGERAPARPRRAGPPPGRALLHGQPDRPPGQAPHEPAVLDDRQAIK